MPGWAGGLPALAGRQRRPANPPACDVGVGVDGVRRAPHGPTKQAGVCLLFLSSNLWRSGTRTPRAGRAARRPHTP